MFRKLLFITAVASLVAISANALSSDLALTTLAQSVERGAEMAHGEGTPTEFLGDGGVVTTIVNIMLFIIGALSVIMLIYGGLRYVISGGNASSVTAAKNTILYAIVGLVIALFAYAAINFVIGTLTGSGGGAGGSGWTNV